MCEIPDKFMLIRSNEEVARKKGKGISEETSSLYQVSLLTELFQPIILSDMQMFLCILASNLVKVLHSYHGNAEYINEPGRTPGSHNNTSHPACLSGSVE